MKTDVISTIRVRGTFLGGAVLGAVQGVGRVEQGWRIRLVYSYEGAPLLEVLRAA